MIARFLGIVATIIAVVLTWLLGMYIRQKVLEKRYMRIYLSKEDWHDDMDMIPMKNDEQHVKSSKTAIQPKPSNTPMTNTDFFNQVHQARVHQKHPTPHTVVHKKVYNDNSRNGGIETANKFNNNK